MCYKLSMDKFEEYKLQKIKYSYNLEKEGRLFEKARAVVVNDGKVLILFNPKTNAYTVPGGGVDEGETVEQAVKREALEESGYEVEPVKKIWSNFYEVPMEFEGKKFISHRVEYFYLCTLKNQNHENVNGIEGEYECKIMQEWSDFEKLKNCGWKPEQIQALKNSI